MKKFASVVLSLAVVMILAMPVAEAERTPGSFGIGVGSTTIASGLSLKQFAGPTALQFTAGCWGSCDGVAASVDFLVPQPAFASGGILALAWNFGAGPALGIGDGEIGAAGSFVLGLEVIFQPIPIDLVLEWRPAIHILPDVDAEITEFGGHLRLYFR